MKTPDFVQHWTVQLGAQADTIVKLQGGINNLVFCCGNDSHKWVIKGYPISKPGKRDRMLAELNFLRYAGDVAPGFTPHLTAFDSTRRCLILEFVHGQHYTNTSPLSQDTLGAAGKFFRVLNENPGLAKSYDLPDACEGYLSLTEHLANIHTRLSYLRPQSLDSETRSSATSILAELKTQLNRLDASIQNSVRSGYVSDSIDTAQLCVSPSDFGFHNALRTQNGPVFLDFEFAGWDDPCKASIDFMLQPRIPTRINGTYLLSMLPASRISLLTQRIVYLEPILRLKWIAIILSILNPARRAEIASIASPHNSQMLVQERLVLAQDLMKVFRQSFTS